jgi:uncharacterized protein YbjT (DUF2867 family)
MKIAVAGATGTVGTHVSAAAERRGHQVVALSRASGVDLLTVDRSRLEGILDGVDAVIDVTSTPEQSATASRAFFSAVTRTLLAAERSAGVPHHLALSIVGADRAPHGYYAGKALQEQLVESGDLPWTILPATQFHEFARQMRDRFTVGPVVLGPVMRCRPVSAREVAERLVELAEAGPSGRTADFAGPSDERMPDLMRRYGRALGDRRPVLALPLPGGFGRALRDGTILPAADADLGRETFDAWLTRQPGSR